MDIVVFFQPCSCYSVTGSGIGPLSRSISKCVCPGSWDIWVEERMDALRSTSP